MGIKERKKREKDLRRRQILGAAKELFMLKGFKFSTMEEIADRAELNPATIYQYFASKDDLHASLALESLQYLLKQITEIHQDRKLSVVNKIRRFRDAMYKTYESDPRIFRNVLQFQLATDFKSLNSEMLNHFNEIYRKLLGMFADVYEEGVRQKKFRGGHKMVHADIILGTFLGLMLWEDAKKRANPQKDFFRSTLDRAFEIFIRGIKRD